MNAANAADPRAPWRRKRVFVAGMIVLLTAIGLASRWSEQEPDLLGHPVSYWVLPWRHAHTETPGTVAQAHAAMEPRHVRWLRRQLGWRPSQLRKALGNFISSLGPSVSFEKQDDYREFAAASLGRLGARALPAVPALRANRVAAVDPRRHQAQVAARAALIQLGQEPVAPVLAIVQDPTHPDWYNAADVLARAGTNRLEALRLFATILHGTNPAPIRSRALDLYCYLQPPLQEGLSNISRAFLDPGTRRAALNQAFGLGPSAVGVASTPGFALALTDPDPMVRTLATNCLNRLTPDQRPIHSP